MWLKSIILSLIFALMLCFSFGCEAEVDVDDPDNPGNPGTPQPDVYNHEADPENGVEPPEGYPEDEDPDHVFPEDHEEDG